MEELEDIISSIDIEGSISKEELYRLVVDTIDSSNSSD